MCDSPPNHLRHQAKQLEFDLLNIFQIKTFSRGKVILSTKWLKKKGRNCQHLVATNTHGSTNVGLASPRHIKEGSSDPHEGILLHLTANNVLTCYSSINISVSWQDRPETVVHYWSERLKLCIFTAVLMTKSCANIKCNYTNKLT